MSLTAFRSALGRLVETGNDLTARQTCLLIDCVALGPQTVRGAAARLKVEKPAITRAADRLAHLGLLVRRDDMADRRSVLLVATKAGQGYVTNMAFDVRAKAPAQPSRAPALPRAA